MNTTLKSMLIVSLYLVVVNSLVGCAQRKTSLRKAEVFSLSPSAERNAWKLDGSVLTNVPLERWHLEWEYPDIRPQIVESSTTFDPLGDRWKQVGTVTQPSGVSTNGYFKYRFDIANDANLRFYRVGVTWY